MTTNKKTRVFKNGIDQLGFESEGFPSCCGIVVLCDFVISMTDDLDWDYEYDDDTDVSATVTAKVRDKYIKEWETKFSSHGVNCLVATTVQRSQPFVHALLGKTGWKKTSTFISRGTGNIITNWVLLDPRSKVPKK